MRAQRGFTYVGLLLAVALAGVALAAAGTLWSTTAKRDKELELLFVGDQFRRAIGAYYEGTPGAKRYPLKLEDLLEDKRLAVTRRHLRQLYADPMTGKADWELVRLADGAGRGPDPAHLTDVSRPGVGHSYCRSPGRASGPRSRRLRGGARSRATGLQPRGLRR
jgi:type II secretory pathway pseudopilin PulG